MNSPCPWGSADANCSSLSSGKFSQPMSAGRAVCTRQISVAKIIKPFRPWQFVIILILSIVPVFAQENDAFILKRRQAIKTVETLRIRKAGAQL